MKGNAALTHQAYLEARRRGASVFTEPQVKQWLRERGVPVPRGRVVTSARAAAGFARESGYPVVLKAVSDRLLHKTEAGGVRTGISSAGALEKAFREIASRAAVGYLGVLVEEQVPPGVEVIVGLQNDPHFGPVIMTGSGGTLTDIIEDVSFRMLPLRRSDVKEMLSELKAYPLLKGYRGSPPVDMKALESTVAGIARLGEELAPFFRTADFNPVIAGPGGAYVVDAKVELAEAQRPNPFAFEKPRTRNLGAFFNPKSVAVVGASAVEGKIGNVIVDSLVNYEFKGRVYPVNPNRDEILGVRCYPSLESLPEVPELVVMVVDLERGPDLMRGLANMGVHNLLIVSGGGKELGGAREHIEAEMSRLSRELDIRVLGPNCIGAFDGRSRFDSFFHHHSRMLRPPAGVKSFITQSGTWGCGFLESSEHTGVAKMVSYGNRVDVDEGDLVAYLSGDPHAKVIGSYIEGLADGRKFLHAAREAVYRAEKPVVVYKTGRTRRSAEAAVSHTGAYGGTYPVYDGLLRQAGIITVDSFQELYAACEALALQPAARGPRAAMLSNGAGPMVNALDLFPSKGLEAVRLSRRSVERMRARFSFFYLVENPVDVTGSASAEDYEFVIRTLLEDPKVDIIMPFFVFQDTPLEESIIERVESILEVLDKPVVGCAVGGPYTRRMSGALAKAGLPVLPDVNQWVTAASALVRWGRINRRR